MYTLKVWGIAAILVAVDAARQSDFWPSGPGGECSCPLQWQVWGNECYNLITSALRYVDRDDANYACNNMAGKVAFPRSSEEMNFMDELAQRKNPHHIAWIVCNSRTASKSSECNIQRWDALDDQDCLVTFSTSDDGDSEEGDSVKDGASRPLPPSRVMCVRPADCTPTTHQPARRYCFLTDTHGRIPNSTCLLDHTIREFITQGVAACGSACADEPRCRSFNIKKTEDGEKICQLNNITSSEDKVKFQNTGYFCMYSELCIG